MMDLFQETNPRNQSSGRVLRPHQSRAIEMMRDEFRNGHRKVVLQMATGSGKTFTASEIIKLAQAKNPRARVAFTVPMLNLIDQTVSEFEDEGIFDIGVIQGQHPRRDDCASVQVASVQTLARRDVPDFDLVLVDEAHIRSAAILDMMEAQPKCRFVGLSATPWRKGMGAEWDALCVAATTAELIEAGLLADFRVYAPDVPDMTGAKIVAGDYTDEDADKAMRPIVGNIVAKWLELGQNQPTLGFAVNRVSAKHMQERFEAAGISTGYIDGFTDPIERAFTKRQFETGAIKVIWSVRTMTTGVDLPVGCVIDAAPTRSEMLHVQKIGRALRINPGCGDSMGRAIILDHAGNTAELGFVTDIVHHEFVRGAPSEAKEREKKERLPKPCVQCDFMIPPKVTVCPSCGAEKALPPPAETVDGDLSEMVRAGKPKDTIEDKQRFWSMALWLDDDRGRGGKLAKGLYKGRFDVWPRGLSDRRVKPDQAFFNYERSRRIRWAKRMKKQKGAANVALT